MTQKTMIPDWEAFAKLNRQPQVWAYPVDTTPQDLASKLAADKNVFMVQRYRGQNPTVVIGDTVSISRPADQNGQQAFSLGIYKEQLTSDGDLTPAGKAYSKVWGVHAHNTYGMVQWALSYNHDRNQPCIDYTAPAQP